MPKIVTEIREEEFDLSFPESDKVIEHFRNFDFWRDCCFKYTPFKIRILESLYKPIRKPSAAREDLYKLADEFGYDHRTLRDNLKELEKDGMLQLDNGSVLTTGDKRILRNILSLLLLWRFNGQNKKPKGRLPDIKLRHYLPSILSDKWKPLNKITKDYIKSYGLVTRDTIKRVLDSDGDVYEPKIVKKGKYNSYYYRLKT